MGTKNNPGQFDCFANAEPDEEMFVLLGRDQWAGSLVRRWADLRAMNGESEAKVAEALACAAKLDAWCMKLGKQPRSIDELTAGTRLELGLRDFLIMQTGVHLEPDKRMALRETIAAIFKILPDRVVMMPPGFAFQTIKIIGQ